MHKHIVGNEMKIYLPKVERTFSSESNAHTLLCHLYCCRWKRKSFARREN